MAKKGKKGNLTTFIKDEHVKYSDNQTDVLFNFDFSYLCTKTLNNFFLQQFPSKYSCKKHIVKDSNKMILKHMSNLYEQELQRN